MTKRAPRDDASPEPAPIIPTAHGVVSLAGYGVRVGVERGHLTVTDGWGRQRRAGRVSRVAGLRRLVIVGDDGAITLAALRWLHDVGASFMQITTSGAVIAATGPTHLDDARLRRSQALAAYTDVGLTIARDLIREKLIGHATNLAVLSGDGTAGSVMVPFIPALDTVRDAPTLRKVEADAASCYWQRWEAVPLQWAKADAPHVPAHWHRAGGRLSPLTGDAHDAISPVHAMLNYGYTLLEAESVIALRAVGLDPGMGMLHVDERGRDSFALDLMEVARHTVDAFVLETLRIHTFRARDFHETERGVCRLTLTLSREFADITPRLATAVAPFAESLAKHLWNTDLPAHQAGRLGFPGGGRGGEEATDDGLRPPTRERTPRTLTGKRLRTPRHQAENAALPTLPPTCRACGFPVPPRRRFCDTCIDERRQEVGKLAGEIGGVAFARWRAAGNTPTVSAEGLAARAEKCRENRRVLREWKAEQEAAGGILSSDYSPDMFTTTILPGLKRVMPAKIMLATGLSKCYVTLIKRGTRVPHPRHWAALRVLVADTGDLAEGT